MTKLQKYLLAILGLQFALILVVFLFQKPVAASNNLIYPDLKIENVSEIKISDSTGNEVSMQKTGNQWVLPLQDGFPVLEENVQLLIEKLALIRDNRLITQSEASHERLSISEENFVRKVELTINNTQHSLYFGSSPATSNIHFRMVGKSEVYLTNALTTSQLSSTISSWVDTLIYQIPDDNANLIKVSNAQGEFVFRTGEENTWTSEQIEEGYQFDQSKWSSVKTALTTLRFIEPVSKTSQPEFGLDTPITEINIEYTNEQGETMKGELLIGNTDDQGNYFVKWSGSEYIYKVSSYNAERSINLTSEDFSSPIATEETIQDTNN